VAKRHSFSYKSAAFLVSRKKRNRKEPKFENGNSKIVSNFDLMPTTAYPGEGTALRIQSARISILEFRVSIFGS
jgi:hypothetical protein